MVLNRGSLLLVFLFALKSISAQVDRYMVFFTDKNNSSYSINNPEEFLSPKSIERRTAQDIQISEEDLPVNQHYIDSVVEVGVAVFHRSKWFNAVLVEATSSEVNLLENMVFIDSISYVAPGSKLAVSNGQGGLKEESNEFAELAFSSFQNGTLGIPQMHQSGYVGQGILIGVFDGGFSGVNGNDAFDHLFDQERMVDAFDFVRNAENVFDHSSHGMHVLSCLAAIQTGEIVGTAPYADYLLYITEDDGPEHRIEEYNWLFAAERADSIGVDIINTSVGYYDFDDPAMNYSQSDFDGNTTVITRAAQKAAEKGIVVVCSAGNEGNDPWNFLTAPADAQDILAVGAIRSDSTVANFSSPGPTVDNRTKPDLVALGSSVTVATTSGTARISGTSFSAPLVAGLAAGYWQSKPELTALEVVQDLRESGHLFQTGEKNNQMGYGIPSFTRLTDVNLITAIDEETDQMVLIYPNPVESDIFYIQTGSFFSGDVYQAILYDLTGSQLLMKSINKDPFEQRETMLISELKPGNYILKLTDGSKDISSQIVIR